MRDGDDDALPNAATGCEAQAMEEHAAEDIKHIPPTTARRAELQKKRREEIGPRRKRGRPARAQAQEEDTALAMCAAAGTL